MALRSTTATYGVAIATALVVIAIGLLPLVARSSAAKATPEVHASPMAGMGPMDAAGPTVPPVAGYAEGEEIRFIHTETSDPDLAATLTAMMGGSPVLVVPALADVPDAALATVYAFTNGVMPDNAMGPLGFQPDVFDRPPGTEGYSPLRAVNLVTWRDEQSARVLKSAAEVQAAAEAGEVAIAESGIVVNMPFLTWPGGHR
ncbi:MAG: DUF7482 domain-containing protein [Thermomicrobiales bacterium]